MLMRSPRSRIARATSIIAGIIALLLCGHAVLTLVTMTHRYGQRTTYVIATRMISQGEQLTSSNTESRDFFSKDAPPGALRPNDMTDDIFARANLSQGSFLTQTSIASDVTSAFDSHRRIMFIPTHDYIDPTMSHNTDLLSVNGDGSSSRYVARNATIIFPTTRSSSDTPGYFVNVNEEEAGNITTALATGDIRFALRTQSR